MLAHDGIETAQIEARCKAVQSFTDKIVRKGEKYNNPIADITDLVGLRVIVYYPDDVDRVGKVIAREFDVDADNSLRRGVDSDPDRFGYRSDHYVVRLGQARRELSEWEQFAALRSEIQVRTVMQHAWAAVDHKIRYKGDELPTDLRRRLYRLSALLETADEQFAALRAASEEVRVAYRSSLAQGDFDLGLDALSLQAYLSQSKVMRRWVDAAVDLGYQREDEADADLHLTLEALLAAGIVTVAALDEFVLQADDGRSEAALRAIQRELGELAPDASIWANLPDVLAFVLMYERDIGPDSIHEHFRMDIGMAIRNALRSKQKPAP